MAVVGGRHYMRRVLRIGKTIQGEELRRAVSTLL
jgi:hypothetical protein